MSKKLCLGYHNGWQLINKKGMNNFYKLNNILLKQENPDNLIYLGFNGESELDNVIIENEEMKGAIIMQLEYDVEISIPDLGSVTEIFVLGWMPIYIKDLLHSTEEGMSFTSVRGTHRYLWQQFILGPSTTVD